MSWVTGFWAISISWLKATHEQKTDFQYETLLAAFLQHPGIMQDFCCQEGVFYLDYRIPAAVVVVGWLRFHFQDTNYSIWI